MSLYATLHTCPTRRPVHEMVYITRGASAQIEYPLPIYYRLSDIEQITFTFKQGKKLSGFQVFDYTTDEEGNSSRQINSQFYHFNNDGYDVLILNLDSEDTKNFKAGRIVEYEVTLKLNTDAWETCGGNDSIIIEPQHSIEVRDSLYSYLEEN